MSRCNPDPIEKYRMEKAEIAARTRPTQTPDRDQHQRALSGDRIQAGTLRERRRALTEGRFIP